jgi:alkylation response protein AidB-like acyl-CoA dehydrogenase
MNFDFSEREEAFRKEVRAWLERNLPDDLRGKAFAASRADVEEVRRLRVWQKTMAEAGYVGMDWPREFGGRGAPITEMVILYQEMARAESPQIVNRGGVSMLGPTLMKLGTPEQQKRFLPRIRTAEDLWCQGFSEPNAGSDLANLQTRAVLDGDHFVVNGQKVWTSMGHVADWCFLLVRTDPTAARHKGISFLLVDMKTPGITVRPLRQITGEAEFNETFFDNVRVPKENLVGKINEGWSVAITTLAYERDLLTFIRHISLRNALHRLVKLTQSRGRNTDPVIRQKIAELRIGEQALQLNGYRSLTKILRGGQPGPEGSTSKLFWSQLDQELALAATHIIGPYSQIAEGSPWAPDDGQWQFYELLARGSGIRAGTTEILRNILGERVLGLPKD